MELDHAILEGISLPREAVRLLLLSAATEDRVARSVEKEIEANSPRQDRVWLAGGDALSGEVVDFDGKLRFRTAGQELSLAASDIAAIYFHDSSPPESVPNPSYWLGLADGTTIAATAIDISQDVIELTTTSGKTLTGQRKDQVVLVQRGLGQAYLSDLEPLDYLHTPYFEFPRPLARNTNLDHRPACVASNRYLKCLAMPTAARGVFQVPPEATRFCAHIGIDDSSSSKGSAVFRVYKVVDQSPQLAFESPIVRGGDRPLAVNVPLEEAQAIVLVVDFADYGDELDHCLWLDPRWVAEVLLQ